jgi:hypothetical protein
VTMSILKCERIYRSGLRPKGSPFRLLPPRTCRRAGQRPGSESREKRIVTWGRRFEGFTSGDVKGVAGCNRRREFDNSAVGARSSRGSREAVDSCSPEVRGSGGQGCQPRARAGEATRSALSARRRTAQSAATADEETVQIAPAIADCAGRIEEFAGSD